MNPHSNLASLYRYFYMTDKLPNNLCIYFWGLLLLFICLPFTWLAMIFNYFNNPIQRKEYKSYDDNIIYYYTMSYKSIPTMIGFFFSFLTISVSICIIAFLAKCGISETYFVNRTNSAIFTLLSLYVYGLIFIFISICLFFGIIHLVRLLPKKSLETNEEYLTRLNKDLKRMEHKRNNPNFITLACRWLIAFKEKNCPLLDWDYTKKEINEKKTST